ncbi:multifunctional transcriptional regulator/nicotinamide-nucleotide adenylyltransferase/ribosylnicotinamide kinase NadR [Candidatus Pacearchaeota archaeon]|nr:multifunctional transcriptional regulator/nicotinamide-nucleotide adenylyltransferase/ribosylnicotinamide kinase NadR [Candidatus Pacearchaeota archaeon]
MENKTVGFIGGKYLPFHQGHVYTIMAASNQVDKLYVVLSSCENRDREICKRDGIKYISAKTRLKWIGRNLSNLSNIEILHIEDDSWEHDYDWEKGANMIKQSIEEPIDFVFSSEHSYDKLFRKYYPDSKHVVIDDKRKTVCVTATEVRRNLYSHWDKLPKSVRADFVKKVAIVGTESCGKSTLVKKLAKFYDTTYVPEVGRKYCKKYSNQLTEEMFPLIAMKHFLLQDKKAQDSNKILFIDTDATITQYYLDMYFQGKKSPFLEEIIKLQEYDLVIYLEPDVKWVSDGLRFSGKNDERFFNNEKLKKMFRDRQINFVSVNGDYAERFNKARSLVDKLLERGEK